MHADIHWTAELKIPTTEFKKIKNKSATIYPQKLHPKPEIEPLAHTELHSNVKVEMAILGSPHNSFFCGGKATLNLTSTPTAYANKAG